MSDDIKDITNPNITYAPSAEYEVGRAIHQAIRRHMDKMAYVLAWFPLVSTQDFADKMVESFIEEYTLYADMERTFAEHEDELDGNANSVSRNDGDSIEKRTDHADTEQMDIQE